MRHWKSVGEEDMKYVQTGIKYKEVSIKYVISVLSVFILYTFFLILNTSTVFAASSSPSASFNTKAVVKGNILDISGYISPYASLAVSSDGNVLRTTVADAKGYFTIDDIAVWQDMSEFCIDAVDAKRLGESYSCFTYDPSGNNDLFLPPTISITDEEITAGGSIEVTGYTMPNAEVTVYLDGDTKFTVTADSQGFYRRRVSVGKGSYQLIAEASFNGKKSAFSMKPVPLKSVSIFESGVNTYKRNWVGFSISIIIVVLITATIIYKKHKEQVIKIFRVILRRLGLRKSKLHHAWFIGY